LRYFRLKRLKRADSGERRDNPSKTIIQAISGTWSEPLLLLNDVRSRDALLGVIDTGKIAMAAVSTFSNAALDPVNQRFSAPESDIKRVDAALTLGQMLVPRISTECRIGFVGKITAA